MSTRPTPEQLDTRMTPRLQALRRDPRPTAFDVPGGWYQIVADLDRELEAHSFWFRYSQIKADNGELIVHIDYAGDMPRDIRWRVQELTTRARERSATVCEECGAPGEQRFQQGWWGTRCDTCLTEHVSAGRSRP
ncbi:hypothetical protein ACIFOC_00480 [Leucobacter aridicollis]|uniref:hypothetical protein n=1 Tax=Leucobacter aridicollis TaxID=283878 RepID=UPI0037CAE84D